MTMQSKFGNYTKILGIAFSFGVSMAAYIFLGYYGGSWLDRKLDTDPTFLMVGVLLGVFLGFYNLFQETKKIAEKKDKQKENQLQDDQTQGK